MEYEPFVLEDAGLEGLASGDYFRFMDRVVFEAGLRMLLERHRRRPEYPFPDTKFNPNTGEDLPPESYLIRYPWFFGRGAEACEMHRRALDDFEGLADVREEVRDLLEGFVRALTDAIVETMDKNGGRCPFRVDEDLRAVDAGGNPVEADPEATGAGDLFCAKGLVASGLPGKVEKGKAMFGRYLRAAKDLRYESEQVKGDPSLVGHGPYMLALGGIGELLGRSADDAERLEWVETAAEMLDHVLDRHYDAETAVFCEYVTRDGAERVPRLDPGHANELVGLGLQAVDAARSCGVRLPEKAGRAFERAERELPRLLLKSFELGYDREHHGIYKLVDNRTGDPLNDDLPWWNLPETMRAAVRAAAVVRDAETRRRLLDVARVCSNDYFRYYINPDNFLFPFQTRSGKTGEVIDVAPAIPEGDPLYHTNLALLDMKDVLRRMRS